MFDCNDENDQIATANSHAITQTTFDSYLIAFWGTTSVPPVVKTWASLLADMEGSDCETTCWKLTFDPNDTTNNTISFAFQALTGGNPPAPTSGTVYYSFALFKGLVAANPTVTDFYFYKATNGSSNPDVIFTGVDSSTNPVYFGDLSALYP